MAQQTFTVNELIIDSLHLINELSEGEVPDGSMMSRGYDLVNQIINYWTSDGISIPVLHTLQFTTTANQQRYSVSDIAVGQDIDASRIIDLVYCNYTVPDENNIVDYPIAIIDQSEYYNNRTFTTLTTRLAFVFLDKQVLESILVFYPIPDRNYIVTIRVKSMLDQIEENHSLITLPPYYYMILKYALAREFVKYYPSGSWSQIMEDDYILAFRAMKSANVVDVSLRPSVLLDKRRGYSWTNILVR